MSRRLAPQERLLRGVTEEHLREDIREAAQRLGWTFHFTYDSRRSPEDWPVCSLVKMQNDGTARALVLELKTEEGKVTPGQAAMVALLSLVPGITARVIRPHDWDWVLDEMQR